MKSLGVTGGFDSKKEGEFAFENLGKKLPFYLRGPLYYGLTMMIIWYSGKEQQFIYFQF